ncbi:MAG: helicase HerA-like domain-containing protein [Rickettsiales bacterium]
MLIENSGIYLGQANDEQQRLLLKYANRHGLIAGATGTGKTVTLQGLVEGFSQAGVPVFIADVKGDLSGLAMSGVDKPPLLKRAEQIGFSLNYQACPVIFWDLFGKNGHPVRTTISEMGPMMLARLLELNDTQEGVLNIAFTVADNEGLLLLDMDDLRAMLNHVNENREEYSTRYGNISAASVGAIMRGLLSLEAQGGKQFFGEPALKISDLMKVAPNGQGAVNILSAESLMRTPKIYSTLLLWLLSELFEDMPEVGDMEKPKLVFFFDEAHLLFDDAPKILLEKIEQLVRLIRSKGVGIYFVTQNPADIPDDVLGQLGNRVQHALRAFTPKDQKGVKAAAQTFRPNPAFKTEDAITTLGVGEALVSVLDNKGSPTIVQRTLIRPPLSFIGAIESQKRQDIIVKSPLKGVYDTAINRESAYEILNSRVSQNAASDAGGIWGTVSAAASAVGIGGAGNSSDVNNSGSRSSASRDYRPPVQKRRGRQPDSMITVMTKSVIRTVGSQLGRQIVRGLMGAISRK